MSVAISDQNETLSARLRGLALSDPDYWSFRGNAKRDHGHGIMQYPAMMVPQMVRALLREICDLEGPVTRVGDPFVGSGTVLTEATLRGLDFVGRDINPLAMLLCRVKSGPIFPEALIERAEELVARIAADRRVGIGVKFNGIDKWFKADVQRSLSKIRRGIRHEDCSWARRFFWVALAETVRLCSNSRTSTFKLHIRTDSEVDTRVMEPIEVFSKLIRRNLAKIASLGRTLREDGFLKAGHYTRHVQLVLGDARQAFPITIEPSDRCDVIITSPPYGDNVTTVPYGQYSYLPLQWIDFHDIHQQANREFLCTTHEIDRRSLGGSRRMPPDKLIALCDRSPTLRSTLDCLKNKPADRARRIAAFVRDLDECVPHVLNMLRPAGIMVWVLGNRRVGGRSVPLDGILSELLGNHCATLVSQIRRRIPSKRMAARNSIAKTMANEQILVFRKALKDA